MGQSPVYSRNGYTQIPTSGTKYGLMQLPFSGASQYLFVAHPLGRYGGFLVLMHLAATFAALSAFAELVHKPFLPVAGWMWLSFGMSVAHALPGLMGLAARMDKDRKTYRTLAQHHAPFLQHAVHSNLYFHLLTVALFVFKYTTDNLEKFDEARYNDATFATTEL